MTIMWLDGMVGSVDDRSAVVRGLSAMAAEDAEAEKAESKRLARAEDEREAKLAALRMLGVRAGRVSQLGLKLSEADAKVDDLKDQLQRAQQERDDLQATWRDLTEQMAIAQDVATRSTAMLSLDGVDLLARDRKQRAEDASLTAARAGSALARIRQLDRGGA
jgi:hypothetical protein